MNSASARRLDARRALDRRTFERALHARFVVDSEPPRLIEVDELREAKPAPGLDQFSVIFRTVGGPAAPMGAGVHRLTHAHHGTLDLYLEPITDDPRGVCYRATVCLLV